MATETAAAPPLPLAALHRRLGATLAPLDESGPAVPLRYTAEVPVAERAAASAESAEYVALRRSCGLVDRSWTGRLELRGEDRHRFLNGYVTCDVKGLAPGGAAYGFVTSAQGRILADVTVLAHEDRLWLELPAGKEAAISAHLSRYVLADRVEILPLDEMLPLALLGPRAPEVIAGLAGEAALAGLGLDPDQPGGRHRRAPVAGTEVALERRAFPGGDGYVLWVSASLAPGFFEELLAAAGVVPVGAEALEAVRVEEGVTRFGRDFGADNFPQETGCAEGAVSYSKGCYLGQEVVARIHYRGGVQKLPRGLLFEGDPPHPGARLRHGDRDVGAATSIVASPTLGRPAGLAILHRLGAEPGTRLEVEGGGTAEVRELPLAPGGRTG